MAEPLPDWTAGADALRRFAAIRMIAVDLDGSFVESNAREVEPQLLTLRGSLRHQSIVLAIATGRALNWVRQLEGLLPEEGTSFRATPMVLYNGSVVADRGGKRILSKETLSSDQLTQIATVARSFAIPVLAYSGPSEENLLGGVDEQVLGLGLARGPAREINNLVIDWHEDYGYAASFEPVAVLLDLGGIDQPTAFRLDEALGSVYGIAPTRSGSAYVEIRPAGSNKARGLEVLRQMLGLAPDHVLALGDSDNDVEMLAWAGIGVAVEGATQVALAASDYVCDFGAVEGAIQALRLVHGARRSRGALTT